jgi:hypothetical protein
MGKGSDKEKLMAPGFDVRNDYHLMVALSLAQNPH